MNMQTTARGRAIARQDEQIAQTVARIEEAKRRPSALALMAQRLNISETNLKNTLMETAFKGCRETEFAALVVVANEYRLNPLTKEIYAFPAKGGGIVPVVSIDGWITIANSHPQYDGSEQNFIYDDGGKLFAVETIIYRKDRAHPIKKMEFLSECKRGTEPWKMEHRMLGHKGFIQAARYAFGFSGIYDEDDAEIQVIGEPVTARNVTMPRRDQITYDDQTGEVIETGDEMKRRAEEDEETARRLDAQTMHGDGDDPAIEDVDNDQSKSDRRFTEILEAMGKATTSAQVKRIDGDFTREMVSFTDEQVEALEGALADARRRVSE